MKLERVRIAPINKAWQETLNCRNKQKRNDEAARGKGETSTSLLSRSLLLCTLALYCCIPAVIGRVNITQLKNGPYVYVVFANLHRSPLQINVHLPWSNLEEDESSLATISKNMSDVSCILVPEYR